MKCYILVGGRSSRMGVPKETLELEGRTFLDRVGDAASQVFDEIVFVARKDSPQRQGARTILDLPHADTAPVFGVFSALRDAQDQQEVKAWILAVDYPLMTAELLRFLRDEFENSDAELLVPVLDSRPQMLCAGYTTGLIGAVEAIIRSGEYALRTLLSRAKLLDEPLIAPRFDLSALRNVNTRVEYETLRRLHEQADPRR